MDAYTNPADVVLTHRWTTKADVRKQIIAHQSWNPYDIVNKTGLSQTVLFLSRDMGLDDLLADFCEKVAERALALSNLDGSEVFDEARESATQAYEHAKGSNRRKCAVNAVIDLRHAKATAVCAAAKDKLGDLVNASQLYDSVTAEEDLALANILYDVLKAKGLL
jgi:hypothetical protein